MEVSESDSISVSTTCKDSELGFKSAFPTPVLKPCSNHNQSPDLDHAADNCESLPNELRSKLELKEDGEEQQEKGGGEETDNDLKVSNFNGGIGEVAQEKEEGRVDYGVGDCVLVEKTSNFNGGSGGESLKKVEVDCGGEDDVRTEKVSKFSGGNWDASKEKTEGVEVYEGDDNVLDEKVGGSGKEPQEKVEEVYYGGDDGGWGEKGSNFDGSFGEETQEKAEGVHYDGDDGGWGESVYEDSGWTEAASWNNNERSVGEFGVDGASIGDDMSKKYAAPNTGGVYQYPVRPEAEDCAFYMKTGTCKFGSNCRFNHPLRRKNQVCKGLRGNEESTERSNQTVCKYHLSSGGCKFGKACRYNHSGMRSSSTPPQEFNFLGLPIRPGEKECPYYMRNGSCKYGAGCKFNHPDPTAVGGGDSPSMYSNGGRFPLQGFTQASVATWSNPVTQTETPPFVPLMPLQNQGVSPRSPEWNSYQQPVYVPERNMGRPPPLVMNSPTVETNAYGHHPQQRMQVDEFPERPGEPDCSYFLKTGNCKFRSNCKFHHPKNLVARSPPCILSDKGLPLRPDQNVCTHYSRYGICKFGPACKFDHPVHPPSPMSGFDQHSSYADSASSEGPGITRAESGNATLVQQSV